MTLPPASWKLQSECPYCGCPGEKCENTNCRYYALAPKPALVPVLVAAPVQPVALKVEEKTAEIDDDETGQAFKAYLNYLIFRPKKKHTPNNLRDFLAVRNERRFYVKALAKELVFKWRERGYFSKDGGIADKFLKRA